MYVRDPGRVPVTGPLAPFTPGFTVELAEYGYTPRTAVDLMYVMAQLSRWLVEQHLDLADVTGDAVDRFLADRREKYRKRLMQRGFERLLTYLRHLGVVPEPPLQQVAETEVAVLLRQYRQYVARERGLAEVSIRRYMPAIHTFLAGVPTPLDSGLHQLSAGQVTRFVLDQAGRRSIPDAKNMVSALRSLLRFLFVSGWIPHGLASAVPTVANRKLSTLPGRLDAGQVAALLGSCDRETASGRRAFVVLLLLSRLGLRAHEVAVMQISDIDWRAGELTVRGKGGLVALARSRVQ